MAKISRRTMQFAFRAATKMVSATRWAGIFTSPVFGTIWALGSFIIVGLILGCSSLKPAVSLESQCTQIDWFEIGRQTGTKGLRAAENDPASKCSLPLSEAGINSFETGLEVGLREHCTFENGVNIGLTGNNPSTLCPDFLKISYLSGVKKGRDLKSAQMAKDQLEKRYNELVRAQTQLKSPEAKANKIDLQKEITNIKAKLSRANQEISNKLR